MFRAEPVQDLRFCLLTCRRRARLCVHFVLLFWYRRRTHEWRERRDRSAFGRRGAPSLGGQPADPKLRRNGRHDRHTVLCPRRRWQAHLRRAQLRTTRRHIQRGRPRTAAMTIAKAKAGTDVRWAAGARTAAPTPPSDYCNVKGVRGVRNQRSHRAGRIRDVYWHKSRGMREFPHRASKLSFGGAQR